MKALLIIDWQNEWIDPESEYYVGSDLTKETNRVNKLISYARSKDFKVILIRHEEETDEAFKPGSKNSELIPTLDYQPTSDTVITKNRINPFYKTDLEKHLKGVDEIYICGILINLCVRSAVNDAYDRDFDITLVEDSCVALTKEIRDFTLNDLRQTRSEIKIAKLKDVIKNEI